MERVGYLSLVLMSAVSRKNTILGIDIGGSGIKGCPVDLKTGEFAEERLRIPTPQPATPMAVVETISQIIDHFKWKGPVGCGFPGVIHRNTVFTSANLDDSFVGFDLGNGISKITGQPVGVINDADAAGLAEMRFGAGHDFDGLALLVTVGTGLGTALLYKGELIPNMETGHLLMKHKHKLVDAESLAADSARRAQDMSWETWAKHFSKYLNYVHALVRPEMFIIGGGIAKKADKFMKLIKCDCEVRVATLENKAGIIGAAVAGAEMPQATSRKARKKAD